MSQSDFSDGSRIIEQSGTSYTIEGFCHRKMVTFNNASAVAASIADPATLGNGFRCTIENLGAGVVTLTPASGTIDGAASLALSQNQGAVLWSDGTNLFTERGMGTGSGSFAAGGDLSGTSSSQTVIGLEGKALDSATVGSPSDGDVIAYDGTSGKYKASAPAPGSTVLGGYSQNTYLGGGYGPQAANRIQLCLFFLPGQLSISNITVRATGSDATNLYSVGIYDSSGNLVASTGTFHPVLNAVHVLAVTGAPLTLNPGMYFFAFTGAGTAGSIEYSGGNSSFTLLSSSVPAATSTAGVLPGTITVPALTGGAQPPASYGFILS